LLAKAGSGQAAITAIGMASRKMESCDIRMVITSAIYNDYEKFTAL
jgi:hypothetical protein